MKRIEDYVYVLILFASVFFAQAQETIPATGGNAIGSGGSASYTIGQVAYIYQASSGGSFSQGVQQPFEISIALGVEEATGITIQSMVYPNPTVSNVTLRIENYNIENLSYFIFDINGRSITSKKISNNETFISMENFAVATYFIKIMENNKDLKTFKIIKNN